MASKAVDLAKDDTSYIQVEAHDERRDSTGLELEEARLSMLEAKVNRMNRINLNMHVISLI